VEGVEVMDEEDPIDTTLDVEAQAAFLHSLFKDPGEGGYAAAEGGGGPGGGDGKQQPPLSAIVRAIQLRPPPLLQPPEQYHQPAPHGLRSDFELQELSKWVAKANKLYREADAEILLAALQLGH